MIEFKITDKAARSPKIIKVNCTRLATQTGYHKSHLSRVFGGTAVPSVICLSAAADALGLTMDEVWNRIKTNRFKKDSTI